MAPPITPLRINGEYKSIGEETFQVKSLLSQEVVGVSASATLEDCAAAVATAHIAFKSWSQTSLTKRRAIFLRASELSLTEEYRVKITNTYIEELSASPQFAGFLPS